MEVHPHISAISSSSFQMLEPPLPFLDTTSLRTQQQPNHPSTRTTDT